MNNYITSYRPGMTRRNARKRGPIESEKYNNDIYERIVDLTKLYKNTENIEHKLDIELGAITKESKKLHHDVNIIEKKINRIFKEVT